MTYKKLRNTRGRILRIYQKKACKKCELREKCTDNKTGRAIERWAHKLYYLNLIGKVIEE